MKLPRRRYIALGAPGLLLALALLLIAPPRAAAAPTEQSGSPSLVISEVYAPTSSPSSAQGQWFEIYNPTKLYYPLNGLLAGNTKIQVPLNTDVILKAGGVPGAGVDSFALVAASAGAVSGFNLPAGVQIVEAPELFPLETVNGAVLLLSPTGLVIDQVNWGTPDPKWPNYNAQMWTGMGALTDANRSWGRTPPGLDTNSPGDWKLHTTVSPGGAVAPATQPALFGPVSDIVAVLAGLLLWLAFVLIGVLAYRFERLRGTPTYWQLLLLAPTGLLFFTATILLALGQPGRLLTDEQRWLAFAVLLVSAILCLAGVYLFRNVARVLLEGKRA